jgi:hypothetical protein
MPCLSLVSKDKLEWPPSLQEQEQEEVLSSTGISYGIRCQENAKEGTSTAIQSSCPCASLKNAQAASKAKEDYNHLAQGEDLPKPI